MLRSNTCITPLSIYLYYYPEYTDTVCFPCDHASVAIRVLFPPIPTLSASPVITPQAHRPARRLGLARLSRHAAHRRQRDRTRAHEIRRDRTRSDEIARDHRQLAHGASLFGRPAARTQRAVGGRQPARRAAALHRRAAPPRAAPPAGGASMRCVHLPSIRPHLEMMVGSFP